MLYALTSDNQRRRPNGKRERAVCPQCSTEVIAHYGTIVTHHWAHKSKQECDPWSEGETSWHLGWKELVKPDCCEVTMKEIRDGVAHHHRADIRNARGVVIELQHSSISPETIRAREAFYGRMVWVVDAQHLLTKRLWTRSDFKDFVPPMPSIRLLEEVHDDFWGVFGCSVDGEDRLSYWPPRRMFRWSHIQRSLEAVRQPLYLDFGSCTALGPSEHYKPNWYGTDPGGTRRYLVDRSTPELQQRPKLPRMFRVEQIHGSYLTGYFVDYWDFLQRYLHGILAEETMLADVFKELVQYRHQRLGVFRSLRQFTRSVESTTEARREAQRKTDVELFHQMMGLSPFDSEQSNFQRNFKLNRFWDQPIEILGAVVWDRLLRCSDTEFAKYKLRHSRALRVAIGARALYEYTIKWETITVVGLKTQLRAQLRARVPTFTDAGDAERHIGAENRSHMLSALSPEHCFVAYMWDEICARRDRNLYEPLSAVIGSA